MRISLIIIFLSILSITYSQPGPGNGKGPYNPAGPARGGIISGTVLESSALSPMEFVNVVLFNSKDSMVDGTITDEKGKFILKDIPFGKYHLTANFIGYEKLNIPDIILKPDKKIIDLGKIKLQASATNLEGVEITGDKQRVVYQLDKKVVNVSQDLKSAGGTAVDVLENVPSVKVDIEGNVTLRGSGSFTVLIDGRPSVLEGNDALQQIPSSSIDRIEIITNPSAKYDPDGTAGIINVVMKKQKEGGLNGIINASVGTKDKYSTSALINYRSGKFNIFGGADYNKRSFSGFGHSSNETYLLDTTNYRDTRSEFLMHRDGWGVKGGADYFMTKKSTLTFSGRYGYYEFGRTNHSKLHLYTLPLSQDDYTFSSDASNRYGHYYESTLNYHLDVDGKGQKLDVMAYYSKRNGDDKEDLNEFQTNNEWISINPPNSQIHTNEISDSWEFTGKADYVKPLGEKGKLEAGYQSKLDYENENFIFNNFDTLTGTWINDSIYSNEYDFIRNVHSAYAIYSNEWKGFGLQVGLRGEYTDRRIKNVNQTDNHTINRIDYFPSIHLSKQFKDKNQFQASYSRRINRVRSWYLDPFVSYMDPYNVRVGNPDLQDEYIDSYELGYQRRIKTSSFVALEAYYRVTNNSISRIKTLLPDGIMENTFANLNTDEALGSELSANIDFTEWLNIFASYNLYYYRIKGEVDNQNIDQSSLNWDSRISGTFKFKHDFRLQASANYEGPSVTAQGKEMGHISSNMAVRKDFFKRKLSATLSARDIFGTHSHESTSSGTGFYNYSYFKRESPIVMLSLSFKLNNYKKPMDIPMDNQQGGGDNFEM